VSRIRAPDVARHEPDELGATPMNPLSHRMGEGRVRGLPFKSNCMMIAETVTLTPALSHPMGEGDPPGRVKNRLAGRGEDSVRWQARL